MASHWTAAAIGTINGVNRLFRTPVPYRTDTVQPIRNGQWLKDSWTELGSDKVRMEYAPEVGDQLLLQYIPL